MPPTPETPPRSSRRTWLFRWGAIVLGLSPLLATEAILAYWGWGAAEQHVDPFVGFAGQRPLFVLNPTGDRYEIARSRYLCFRPDGFAARKAVNEYRIFCLGGSTVQGRPYAIETSFTRWLELSLQAADPQRRFDVVNCGGISYASYRLVPILEEVLQYQPDLIILYTGHNEFLEDRTYRHIKQRSPTITFALRQATKWRTFNLLWSQWNAWQTTQDPLAEKPVLSEEVDARLDYRGGLDQYHRDPAWHAAIVEHFDYNLHRMIGLCQAARVPIWLVDPVCNLRSCPPFKSEHRNGLSDDQLNEWNRLRQEAGDLYRTDLARAIYLLEQATKIDDQHAGLAYDLANCYESLGRVDEARTEYLRAKEWDVCPLRIIEPLRDAIRNASRQTKTPLIDVKGLFEDKSRNRIPGSYLLVDHVHPSITGHQMIAELLMERFFRAGIVNADASWSARRDAAYVAHEATLDDRYYLEAQRRLEGLRKWAAGRATGVRKP